MEVNSQPTAPYAEAPTDYGNEGSEHGDGSLSSLQSSSNGDQDFAYLSDYGLPFQNLANLYADESEEEFII